MNDYIYQVHQLGITMVGDMVQYFSMMLPALDLRVLCFPAVTSWL